MANRVTKLVCSHRQIWSTSEYRIKHLVRGIDFDFEIFPSADQTSRLGSQPLIDFLSGCFVLYESSKRFRVVGEA